MAVLLKKKIVSYKLFDWDYPEQEGWAVTSTGRYYWKTEYKEKCFKLYKNDKIVLNYGLLNNRFSSKVIIQIEKIIRNSGKNVIPGNVLKIWLF